MTIIRTPRLLAPLAALFLFSCAGISHEQRGDEYFHKKQYDSAITEYKLALAEDNNPAVQGKLKVAIDKAINDHMRKGNEYMSREDFQNAIAEFTEVLQIDSRNQLAASLLGDAKKGKTKAEYESLVSNAKELFREKKLADAKRELLKATEIYDKNRDAQEGLKRVTEMMAEADEFVRKGKIESDHQSWTNAINFYRKALDLWVDHPGALAGIETAEGWIEYERLLTRGKELRSSGLDREAFEEFSRAKKIRQTEEVKNLVAEVGRSLYQPCFTEAVQRYEEAEANRQDIASRIDALEKALSLFEKANKYVDTSESRTKIREIKNELSVNAKKQGVQSLTIKDYSSAVRFLEVALKYGQNVENQLAEAKHQNFLWEGYQAESKGSVSTAQEFYERAMAIMNTDAANAALRRVKTGSSPIRPMVLAASKENRQNYELIKENVIQRFIISSLSKKDFTNETIKIEGASFPELGTGVDTVAGNRKNKVVVGDINKRPVYNEEIQVREQSLLSSVMKGEEIEFDLGIDIPMYWSGGSIGFGSGNRTRHSESAYSLELRYEVITEIASLNKPRVDLADTATIEDWVSAFGTHFVDEVYFGGSIVLTLTTEISESTSKSEIENRFKTYLGPLSFSTGKAQQFQSDLRKYNFNLSAKIRGGSGGVSPRFQDFNQFLSYLDKFKSEVQTGRNPTVIRVKTRYYGDPGVSNFPYDRNTFKTAIERMRAEKTAGYVYEIVLEKGERDLHHMREQERIARIRAEEERRKRLKEGLQAAADNIAKKISAYQSKWEHIDLSVHNVPMQFELVSVTIQTNDKVEVFLVPSAAYNAMRSQGKSVAENTKYSFKRRNWILQNSIFYLDTTRNDPGKSYLNKRLPKGEYYWLVYNHNDLMTASVVIGCEVRP